MGQLLQVAGLWVPMSTQQAEGTRLSETRNTLVDITAARHRQHSVRASPHESSVLQYAYVIMQKLKYNITATVELRTITRLTQAWSNEHNTLEDAND